ncbi:MAG: RNA polymerase sigma factor [Thermogemmata sp.]
MTQGTIDLILQAQNGDKKAFDKLYSQYYQKLLRYISDLCRKANLANEDEDIVQETFLKVWQKLKTLKDPKAFESWLTKIAKNIVYRHTKKKIRDKKSLRRSVSSGIRQVIRGGVNPTDSGEVGWEDQAYNPEQTDPMDGVADREMCETLRQVLPHLSPLHRKVVEEHYLNGRLVAEIAQELNKPEGTIKRLLYEARAVLRAPLAHKLSF